MESINKLLKPVFGQNAFEKQPNRFQFKNVQDHYITQVLEGQLDTGKMMHALLGHARKAGILILNGLAVDAFEEHGNGVTIKTTQGEYRTQNLLVTTNGFASELLNEDVVPARAQVLVTKPIPDLAPLGTFHLDHGYYYFRNIGNRLLLGGGRNLDFEGETTTAFGQTEQIQDRLEQLLSEVILPGQPFEIERRWSGIMGVGTKKDPIVRQLTDRVFCGVRLGGMGIAIGSLVGSELAALVP
jgi:glycine/D-amino acid oxidase-like deaminating enzyme